MLTKINEDDPLIILVLLSFIYNFACFAVNMIHSRILRCVGLYARCIVFFLHLRPEVFAVFCPDV